MAGACAAVNAVLEGGQVAIIGLIEIERLAVEPCQLARKALELFFKSGFAHGFPSFPLDREAGPRPASRGRASGGLEGENRLRGEPPARNGAQADVEEGGRKPVWGREGRSPRPPSKANGFSRQAAHLFRRETTSPATRRIVTARRQKPVRGSVELRQGRGGIEPGPKDVPRTGEYVKAMNMIPASDGVWSQITRLMQGEGRPCRKFARSPLR